jgi:hypothetical protein
MLYSYFVQATQAAMAAMTNAPSFDGTNITQLTEVQAIACNHSKQWEGWDLPTRALFQIHQDRLCMPFSVFHEAIEKTLKRPVFTHEFTSTNIPRLKSELFGLVDAPTFDRIIALLP